MRPMILMTGASGFIGRRILKELLANDLPYEITCLVESRFTLGLKDLFQGQSNLRILEADITKPHLGVEESAYQELRKRTISCFHLAALYNLSVSKEVAEKVNVEGTVNVLKFLNGCETVSDLFYFSTCYVAGNFLGPFSESDLEIGQTFKNHYEETKYEAEKRVREWIKKGGKGVIVRPGIVCGDSQTGETEKFDGLYFVMEVIERLRFLPVPLPKPGSLNTPSNLVPVDFLVDVAVRLWEKRKDHYGQTFQVTDPNPLSSSEVFELLCEMILNKRSRGQIPPWVLRLLFQVLSMGRAVPKEILDYFDHQSRFDCSNLESFLKRENLVFPDMKRTMPTLHRYWKEKRTLES